MSKHTILFLAANPLGTDRLALDMEARVIQQELERSRYRDQLRLETRWAAQPMDLLRELRNLKPTVVHFSGHGHDGGAAATPTGRGIHRDVVDAGEQHRGNGLFFHGPDGRLQLVSTADLVEAFGAAGSSVELVVLSACHSEAQAEALRSHVGCVVAIDGPILDDDARAFAAGFYGGLAARESVSRACKQGVASIRLARSDGANALGEARREPVVRLLVGPETDPDRVFLVDGRKSARRCSIVIKAKLADFDPEVIARVRDELRRLTGDITLEIIEVQEGSVRLTVALTGEAAEELERLRDSGELSRLCGFDVSSLRVEESSEDREGLRGGDIIDGKRWTDSASSSARKSDTESSIAVRAARLDVPEPRTRHHIVGDMPRLVAQHPATLQAAAQSSRRVQGIPQQRDGQQRSSMDAATTPSQELESLLTAQRPAPLPGATPTVGPPLAGTLGGQPRARRSSGVSHSAWNTFDSSAASLHATSAAPHAGVRINQYELIKLIGEGSMGSVFLARDLRLGRRVTIKFLQSNQPELTQRFLIEARATARCNHENIIVIHEVGEHDGSPFMVLEYLQGVPLTQLLQDGRRLTPAQAVELIVPVVRALVAAHAHNIVHRDLKPDNIFVTDSGAIKVLDFGIAKLAQGDEQDSAALMREANHAQQAPGGRELTRRGHLMGTLPYMSPEQWGAGNTIIDHQTDLWAVGIILFEMVAGHHPLAPRTGWNLMITGIVSEPMPSVRGACPSLPDELADVIDRCLRKPKDQRVGSARELCDALEPLLPGRFVRRLRSNESPYAGLKSFQESDAHRFFGRARDVAAAVARLRDAPLLGIIGPSGVGKSSLVRAGIVPALKASGESWSTLVIRPGRTPMAALAYALTPMLSTSNAISAAATTTASSSEPLPPSGSGMMAPNSTEAIALLADLSHQRQVVERLYLEPGYLGTALRCRARAHGQHILLFIDQFEELYTQVADPRERLAFAACLAGVCDDVTTPLRLVVSLRSDFLDYVAEAPALMAELTHALYFVTPPNRDGLRDALIQPAEMAGYQFEDAKMIESMLDHLEHTPGALPLLQFAASQLWETRDRDRRLLTAESYHRVGGIAGALASHADAVVAECTPREQTLVRAMFLRLVTPERTRAIVPVNELFELSPDPGEVYRVLDRLVRSRLLVGQTTANASGATTFDGTIEIVHESLISGWPLLRRWLDETQEDAGFLEQLCNAAKQWKARGFANDLLWRGEAMQEAKLWRSRYRGELPDLQRAYLDAVFALSVKATRRRRLAIIAAMAFLSLLIVAAGVALYTIRAAQKEATAQARRAAQQLSLTQTAEKAAKAAELTANVEREKAIAASKDLAAKNAKLIAAIEDTKRAQQVAELAQKEAEDARLRAEKSKHDERLSRRRATEAAAAASAAALEVQRANQRLEVLLAQEKKRVEELEAQTRGVKIIPDTRVHDR